MWVLLGNDGLTQRSHPASRPAAQSLAVDQLRDFAWGTAPHPAKGLNHENKWVSKGLKAFGGSRAEPWPCFLGTAIDKGGSYR
jgi:hypothetical protein